MLATVRVPGRTAALAAAGDTVYVSFRIGGSGATSDIRAYAFPAARGALAGLGDVSLDLAHGPGAGAN